MNLLVAQLPFEPVTAILVIPGVAALLLALLPGYKLTARLNVFATFLTFLAHHHGLEGINIGPARFVLLLHLDGIPTFF